MFPKKKKAANSIELAAFLKKRVSSQVVRCAPDSYLKDN